MDETLPLADTSAPLPLKTWRWVLILTLILLGAVLIQLVTTYLLAEPSQRVTKLGQMIRIAILIGGGTLAGLAALLVVSWTRGQARIQMALENLFSHLSRFGQWNIVLLTLVLAAYLFLILGPVGRFLKDPDVYTLLVSGWAGDLFKDVGVHLLLFWMMFLTGCLLIQASGSVHDWRKIALASLLAVSVGVGLAAFLPGISSYPFSLGWSEASRYFYASLYFSEKLYGQPIPPTVLHPSRYLLQSIPFILAESPIWLSRAWQVFLWIATTLGSAALLTRRLQIEDGYLKWMFCLWAILFLLMASVYYHLLIIVMLILIGFDRDKGRRTTLIVLLASVWAGISRVNWWPVPGLLAATLFFLEEPVDGRPLWRYLFPPVAWTVLGSMVAFGAQSLYVLWSGNPSEQFSSSFSSDLLWYRLLPNATYAPGILLTVLLVSAPVVWMIVRVLRANRQSLHLLRLLGIGSILAALLAGGLVVSVKIGGGGDLHNLDAYLVALLVVAGYFFFIRFAPEARLELQRVAHPTWLIAVAVLTPLMFTLQFIPFHSLPEARLVDRAIQIIQEAVDESVQVGKPVLFISERQLVLFGDIRGTDLIPEYEKVFLMEMAMANNQEYLEDFHQDLKNHRFGLIVSEPLKDVVQDETSIFGEENNAWAARVVKPILCYYAPLEKPRPLRLARTELLTPKTPTGDCP